MVFNVKIEDFRHNPRLVTGGHMTKAPSTTKYYSIVSRQTVGIDLMITTLDDLEVKLDDMLNAYIQAPVT